MIIQFQIFCHAYYKIDRVSAQFIFFAHEVRRWGSRAKNMDKNQNK